MISTNCDPGSLRPAVQARRFLRKPVVVRAYAPSAAAGVRCITPSSSLHDTEEAIKSLGQAYINHKWCKDLQIRLGKEQDLFQGLARMQLDTFSHDPVLLLSEDCKAAGILLSSQQESQLVTVLQDLDLSVIAGTLQIMQAMPEGRLPKLKRELQQLQEASAQAAQQQGHSSYMKLVCLGVRPEVQCQGLGRALLASALAAAQRERQLLMADVADDAVEQMLTRHGFKALGSSGLFSHMVWCPV